MKPFEKLAKVGVSAIKNLNADTISIRDAYRDSAVEVVAWLSLIKSQLCRKFAPRGDVAQLVEHRTENPCVGGSSPLITTFLFSFFLLSSRFFGTPLLDVLKPFQKLAEAGGYGVKNLGVDTISIRDAYRNRDVLWAILWYV